MLLDTPPPKTRFFNFNIKIIIILLKTANFKTLVNYGFVTTFLQYLYLQFAAAACGNITVLLNGSNKNAFNRERSG